MNQIKTFKEFILEKAILKIDNPTFIGLGYIPLSDKTLKNLGYTPKIITSYHATSLEYLDNLVKIQNKKTSVSTFTKNLSSIIKNITGKPDLVVELKGTAIMVEDFDIFTQVDENGLRWLSSTALFQDKKSFDFWYSGVMKKVFEEISKITDVPLTELKSKEAVEIVDIIQSLKKKDISNIRKTYIKHIEKLTENKMYIKFIKDELGKEAKDKKYSHNEILLENFKIQGVYAIQANKFLYKSVNDKGDLSFIEYQIKEICKDCKFLGFIPREDFNIFPYKH